MEKEQVASIKNATREISFIYLDFFSPQAQANSTSGCLESYELSITENTQKLTVQGFV